MVRQCRTILSIVLWFLTMGCRIKNIAPGDALLVQCLKKAGAVFHVRTNQPQSLMVCTQIYILDLNSNIPCNY